MKEDLHVCMQRVAVNNVKELRKDVSYCEGTMDLRSWMSRVTQVSRRTVCAKTLWSQRQPRRQPAGRPWELASTASLHPLQLSPPSLGFYVLVMGLLLAGKVYLLVVKK